MCRERRKEVFMKYINLPNRHGFVSSSKVQRKFIKSQISILYNANSHFASSHVESCRICTTALPPWRCSLPSSVLTQLVACCGILVVSAWRLFSPSLPQQSNIMSLSKSQELWNKIEWSNAGPHVAPPDAPKNDDTIVAYFAGNAQHRLPPLWKTYSGRILVESDINNDTTAVTPTACNNIAVERLEQALVHKVEEDVLPHLVLQAVMEEALHEVISNAASSTTTTTTTNTTSSSTNQYSLTNPPRYYSSPPSSYLFPPVSPADQAEASQQQVTGYAPMALLQRLKAACSLAYSYNFALQGYQAALNEKESDSRRSRRLAPPTLPTKPNPLVKGGRTCQYFIEYNEKEAGGDDSNIEEDQQAVDSEPPVAAPANDENGKQEEPQDAADAESQDEEEEEPDDQKDDDFEPEEASEDEEAEESMDEDDQELQEVESSSEEESSDSDNDGDDSLDEDDLILSNPHFKPTLDSILDWLGRRGKSLTTLNIQQAIVSLLKNKTALRITNKMDQLVLDQNDSFLLSDANVSVVLECTTGETWRQLQKLELSEFQKCRFRWKVLVDKQQSALYETENQKLLEEQYYAELQYKKQKAWATWRYKGITTGYTTWPQWLDAATEYRKESSQSTTANGGVETTAAAASVTEQQADTSAAAATNTEDSDLALAQAMEEQDASTGRRKSRRGGGDGGAVFYGGQTGMSHKQLLDTIVRMAYQQPFQTMVALQNLVAEESRHPMHRIRVALGKLLWKTNQVTRSRVNSEWTDMPLWNKLCSNQALLEVPAQLKEAQQEDDPMAEHGNADAPAEEAEATATVALPVAVVRNMPTEENLKHLEVLTEYIRNLHKTELELRSLILHHLTSTPIVTVATAADERPGSQEAVDAVHFEGDRHSSLDWSATGHALLNSVIFRPSFLVANQDTPECTWYKIRDFVPSVPMPPADDEPRSDGRPREVFGKEPLGVERRMRFRAFPVTEEGVDIEEGAILVLTEGQVHAGILAAKLEREKEAAAKAAAEHPFAIGAGSNITLQSQNEGVADKHCQVAGYDTVPLENSQVDDLEHRILLLPQKTESSDSTLAFWAVANLDENGILTCRPVGSSTTYKILQSDCDSSSSAFQECQGIIDFLYRQPNSAVFAEPVDPVALKIPTYFSVIKHPMDISTLASNLEKGLYSKIPPGQSVGRSPVARMLNGPFKDDVVRVFDNAMLFNPPDDWIHHTAATMKRAVLRKIDQVSKESDDRLRAFSPRKNRSVYIDEDSDVDMYEYESDRDDEDYGRRATRKRKRVRARDDFATVAMEAPVVLQKTLSESLGLRGPFSSLPINSEAAGFSISSEWNCRHRTSSPPEEVKQDADELKRKQEIEELLMLYRQVEEEERAGLRRSSRAHQTAAASNGNGTLSTTPNDFEYFLKEGILPPLGDEETDDILTKSASSRSEVEAQRETLHEVYFAKLYQQLSKYLLPTNPDGYGSYADSSFPPFLGRVIPSLSPGKLEDVTWEIRAPYVLPAIRWILRGLIHSGHLSEVEPDVLMTNDIYFADDSQQPFDVLDMKEMQRRKRANAASEEEESEEEVEMSEYEKLRAERVARNAERLKALGLA